MNRPNTMTLQKKKKKELRVVIQSSLSYTKPVYKRGLILDDLTLWRLTRSDQITVVSDLNQQAETQRPLKNKKKLTTTTRCSQINK